MSGGRKGSGDSLGCLVYLFLAVVCMPFAGLIMVCSDDPDRKSTGWMLLIFGLILWAYIGIKTM